MSTSPKQTAANQQNALASTGPKTPAGKNRTALNALKHGLRSSAFVVPGLEREEDWKRHLAAMVESLAPANYLEAVLAQDVALLTWRLGRVARAERETVALLQETAEDDWVKASRYDTEGGGGVSPAIRRLGVQERAALVRDLADFAALRTEDLGEGRAEAILFALADLADGLDLVEPAMFTPPPPLTNEDLDPEFSEFQDWTPALLRATAEEIARVAEAPLDKRLTWAIERAEDERKLAEQALARAEDGVLRLQRARILPEEGHLEKVTRYETHLRRSLSKALQELRVMQAQRRSQTVIEAG